MVINYSNHKKVIYYNRAWTENLELRLMVKNRCFPLKIEKKEAGKTVQQLRALLFQRSWLWFLVPMPGSSKLPLSLAKGS